MKKTTLIIIGGVLITVAIIFAIIGVTASNKEVELRSKIEAQKQVCEAFYDKLWKVIKQKSEVTEQYKETFSEIYPKLIEGRYGDEKGGTLMKWITESNPNFDISLYKDLMNTIEAERLGFLMEQTKLVDLNNQHRIIRKKFPNSIFIGGRPDIDIIIVSSSKTKKIMETGEENDIDLFN